MMQTSAPTLRPLSMGEIIDRAFSLYRRNFASFVGIIAVVEIPAAILTFLVALVYVQLVKNENDRYLHSFFYNLQTYQTILMGLTLGFVFLAGVINLVIVTGIGSAALTRTIADNYLGKPTGFGEAYRSLGKSWPRLIGVIALMTLIVIILGIWSVIPCIGWLTGPGILIYFFMVISPVVIPVVILEQRGGAAIRRAWDLVRRRFGWCLGFALIFATFSYLINLALGTVFNYFGSLATESISGDPWVINQAIQSINSILISILFTPLSITAFTLMYFDLRVRTEGFDLSLLAASASGRPLDQATAEVAATDVRKGLVGARELLYFFGIEFVFLVITYVLGQLGLSLFRAIQ